METEDKITKTHHYLVLDSLRGICACIVALFHFRTPGIVANLPFIAKGYLFVDFFFVLSGFVITTAYRDKLAMGFPMRSFLGLRLGRIYPLHLFTLALFIAFELFFAVAMPHAAARQPFTDSEAPAGILYNILLVQIFFGEVLQWNMPSWSIAAEFWTYAIFAILYKITGRALIPVCVLLALGGLATLSVATDHYIAVFHVWSLVRCVVGFSLGVLAQHLFSRWPRLGSHGGTLAELVLVVALVWFVSAADGLYTLAAPPLFMIVVVVFAGQAGVVSRLLGTWPFLYVGSLSYSIYMLHYFIQLRMFNALELIDRLAGTKGRLTAPDAGGAAIAGSPLFGDVMSVVMLALVIGAAAMTYRFVELPGQRWSRARILGKSARPRPA